MDQKAGIVLTESQRESFARDGFLVLDDPCPPELVDQVLSEADSLYHDDFHPGPEVNEDGVIFTRDQGGIEGYHWHRVMNAWKSKRGIRELALAPKVLAATEELFGRRPLPFQTLNFRVGTEQAAHSTPDTVHFNSEAFRLHARGSGLRWRTWTWTTAHSSTTPAATSCRYPSGVRSPSRTGMPIDREAFATEQEFRTARGQAFTIWARELIDRHGFEPQYGTVRKGQALIWAPNLLHGGAPQNDMSRTRHSQVSHYYFEGCRHFSPLHTEGEHVYYRYPEWIREPPPETTPETIREAVQQVVPAGSTVLVAGAGFGFARPRGPDGVVIPTGRGGEPAAAR